MAKKASKKADDVNQKIVEELLSKGDPSQLFGKDGLFNQLKKQIVERVLRVVCGWGQKLGFWILIRFEKLFSHTDNSFV